MAGVLVIKSGNGRDMGTKMAQTEKEIFFGDTPQEVMKKYDEWHNPRRNIIDIVYMSAVEGPKVIENRSSRGYRMEVEFKEKSGTDE
jgi:hypothetical protein